MASNDTDDAGLEGPSDTIRSKAKTRKMASNDTEDAGLEARTVFVRNLPYSFTDSQLQDVFSEIGPVRRSFMVKEKGLEQHRGFGYVQFAVVEDAIRAVEMKDGTDLHGRKVMVKLAKRRPPFEQRRTKKQPNGKPIKGIPESLDTANLEEVAPHTGLSVSGQLPKQEPNKSTSDNKKEAFKEAEKENATSVESIDKKVADITKKRKKHQHEVLDSFENKRKRKKVTAFGDGKSSEKQRVARTVVLGGLISPEMREAVIECAKKVGQVESIQSSLSPLELTGRELEKDGCRMGAALVVFTSVKAASQAVAELHQKAIGGGTVWARQLGGEGSKPKKWRIIIRNLPFSVTEEKVRELFGPSGFVWEATVPRKADGQAKGFAFASFTSKNNAEKAIHEMNGKLVQKRPIAVDWAVERRAYEPTVDAGVKAEADLTKVPSDMEDEETASEDENDFVIEEHVTHEGHKNGWHEDELPASFEEIVLAKKVLDRVVSTSSSKKPGNAESKQTPDDLHNPDEGLTSGKNEDGPQSETHLAGGAQILQPSARGDLQKTVFVKNLPFDVDADTLKKKFSVFGKVNSTFLVLHPKTKRPKGTAFLKFSTAEGADAALAAAVDTVDDMNFAGGIILRGRKLQVLKAVEKKSAEALEKEKLEHAIVDRRNLYLLKEGKIEEGTPAAIGVSEEDMEKRRQLEKVKAIKLRSPKFHVSKTRLAVYNVPQTMNEMELRKLFVDAVKSRATKQLPVIKQVKILKDESKGDKSRGVAFIEFTEHEHSLVAIRVLNNNPGTFGSKRRPIVGFAIENLQTLKKRQERQLATRSNKRMVDHEGSSKIKEKPRRREKRSKEGKNEVMGDGSQLLVDDTRRKSILDAKRHRGLASNQEEREKSSEGHKTKRNGTRPEKATLPGKRRKRGEGGNPDGSNEGNDWTPKSPPSKKPKTANENPKSKLVTKPNKGTLKQEIESPKQNIKGGHTQANKQNTASGGYAPRHTGPKVSLKKKGSKLELEDKLGKLVSVYREKYFSDVSRGAKENKKSMHVKSSSDFKRWFE